MAAGDFSASQLLNIQLKAEQMWTDGILAKEQQPMADAAIAVLENQTARFQVFNDRDKDNKVQVTFINTCAIETDDCDDNCELDEPQVESGVEEYEPDLCQKAGFSVDQETTRTNIYSVEEIAAQSMARAIGKLDEWWARQVLARLATFSGVNVYPQPWTYDNTDKTTEVPTAQYNLSMVAHLMLQAQMNRLGTPYYIGDGTLAADIINAQLNAGNLDGKGDASRITQLNLYQDMYNFARAGMDESLFAISPGAVAFKTTNRNPDAPRVLGGQIQQTIYTVNSRVLPGVKYDVYYTLKCVTGTNGRARYVHTWRLETNGGVWLNPAGCPVEIEVEGAPVVVSPTGILSYTKV